MPFGEETLIGERGVNLSGGQKARVNLARCCKCTNCTSSSCLVYRAVYRDSDIMLLDDPLSAVDATVSRHLFDKYACLTMVGAIISFILRCICGVLADKLVILVTHQLQYAEQADHILVLKEVCLRSSKLQ